ncbi:hypothetical protein QE152_g18954 [Popillia japonica]|uniref:Uncharacterized protein n=1 Tax=Popillia japonica TaxID=7064 RepID=A0AAW1L420_POPJA
MKSLIQKKTEIIQESVLQSIHDQSSIKNHLCNEEFYKNNNTSDLLPENLADLSADSKQETNEVPGFDENKHHEQAKLLGSPSIKNIDMYLLKASTPKRKGKTQTERLPFVLTSTQYKKISRKRGHTLFQKELKKEKNRQKRIKKKIEKEEIRRMKKESKQKSNAKDDTVKTMIIDNNNNNNNNSS